MVPSLKAAFALLSLLQLASSSPLAAPPPKQKLFEIIRHIHLYLSGAQMPCSDTRVAQVVFTDHKLSEQVLLCQAVKALSRVSRCKKDYEPIISNLQSLQGKETCSLSHDNEIYLRHFLPALGNFTQGLFRRLGTPAA
ncbi:hypothetical protein N307_02795, partial [Dryobates pubescens]